MTAERLAVRSKDATVFCPVFDREGFGVVQVNWKTKSTRRLSFGFKAPRAEIGPIFSVPIGIVCAINRNPSTVVVYDTTLQRTVLSFDHNRADGACKLYSIPTVGLMQYCHGVHFRLTETNFNTALLHPTESPSSAIVKHGRIFVREESDRTHLIWGESKIDADSVPNPSISDLVIYDLKSNAEVMRKNVGPNISASFCPNSKGDKIYFVNMKTGEILFMTIATRKVSSFARAGMIEFGGWESAMVSAY